MDKICSDCGKELPEEEFRWRDKKNGIKRGVCKTCNKRNDAEWYQKSETRRKKVRENHIVWQKEYDEWFINLKKTKQCAKCNDDRYYLLDFHHIDPDKKEFGIGNAKRDSYSRKRILKEIEKCEVLCSNCIESFTT